MKASNSSWFPFVIWGKSAFLLSVPDSMKFLAARYFKKDQKFGFSNFGFSISVLNPNLENKVLTPQKYGLEHEF